MSKKTRNAALVAAGIVIGLSLGSHAASWRTNPRRSGRTCRGRTPACLPKCWSASSASTSSPSTIISLLQAAIRGMVSSLDPYSAYLEGDEYDDIKISSSGQYSGVGIEVVDGGRPGRGGRAARRLAGGRGGNSLRRCHCHHRRRAGQHHHAGRHHRTHARQGGHLGQDRHRARRQHRSLCNSRSSARACNCTA